MKNNNNPFENFYFEEGWQFNDFGMLPSTWIILSLLLKNRLCKSNFFYILCINLLIKLNWNYAGLWTTNKILYFLSRFRPSILKWLCFLLALLFAAFAKNVGKWFPSEEVWTPTTPVGHLLNHWPCCTLIYVLVKMGQISFEFASILLIFHQTQAFPLYVNAISIILESFWMFYAKIFSAPQGRFRRTQWLFFTYQSRGSIGMYDAIVQIPLKNGARI